MASSTRGGPSPATMVPMRAHRHAGLAGVGHEARRRRPADGRQDLVVVAAGHDRAQQCRVAGKQAPRRRRQRHQRRLDLGADAGNVADMGEVADETVGHVHGARGMAAQDLCQRHARLRVEIAVDQVLRPPALAEGDAPRVDAEAERGVADGAGNEDLISGPGAGTGHHAPLGDAAERRHRDR